MVKIKRTKTKQWSTKQSTLKTEQHEFTQNWGRTFRW